MPTLAVLTPLCSRLIMVAAFVLGGSCEDEALADEPEFRASAYCEAQHQECIDPCPDDPVQWEACEQTCYEELLDCESYSGSSSSDGSGGPVTGLDSGCGPEVADVAVDCGVSVRGSIGSSIGDSGPEESDDWGEDWGERERGEAEPLAAPVDLPND